MKLYLLKIHIQILCDRVLLYSPHLALKSGSQLLGLQVGITLLNWAYKCYLVTFVYVWVCGGLNALLIYIQMLSEASFKKISLVS